MNALFLKIGISTLLFLVAFAFLAINKMIKGRNRCKTDGSPTCGIGCCKLPREKK
ncbi:MAG: hypothetical protein ACRCSV_00720 [Chlamydiales bacterium]